MRFCSDSATRFAGSFQSHAGPVRWPVQSGSTLKKMITTATACTTIAAGSCLGLMKDIHPTVCVKRIPLDCPVTHHLSLGRDLLLPSEVQSARFLPREGVMRHLRCNLAL